MPTLQIYKIIFELLSIMYIKDFAKLIEQKRKELDKMMRRKMPVIAGRMAKDHFQDNFRKGGFVNDGLHPWPQAKRLSSGRTDAASNYGTLLSGRNHLFSSIKYIPSDYRVKVSNELVYAPIHNWGGTVSVTVTDRMRRFAWAKFLRLQVTKEKRTQGKRRAQNGMENRQRIIRRRHFGKDLHLPKKRSSIFTYLKGSSWGKVRS
jgi:phage gpG-like protein